MAPDPRTQLTAVRAPHGAKDVTLTFGDGRNYTYPNGILRGYCPCAGCQGHGGAIVFQAGNNEELRDITQVGNYALGLTWGDSHSSGIYSFRYLRTLGELLEEHGTDGLRELGELPRK
ncbi:MAG: DUF971 domain-containing protein [Myxococcales bacterium]|nr:DUF971 domain-containing protein [Myxococcales bacterium]MCB9577951.1 DUF971 domain-containing protein [Polyangiaceae bacterium]